MILKGFSLEFEIAIKAKSTVILHALKIMIDKLLELNPQFGIFLKDIFNYQLRQNFKLSSDPVKICIIYFQT